MSNFKILSPPSDAHHHVHFVLPLSLHGAENGSSKG